MKNYIGIVISKNSTAMVIESNSIDYLFSYNILEEKYRWNKLCSELCKISSYNKVTESNIYSDNELLKLQHFSKVSTQIIDDILSIIDINIETNVLIEGYSYGKESVQLVDLVGIGSVIRNKIYEDIPNISIKIIAPKSLKMEVCKAIYGVNLVNIGKKRPKIVEKINNNKLGISGGNFTKTDMFHAIIDDNINSDWRDFLYKYKDDILKNKSIPKPIEDINDAFLLKKIGKILDC